MPAVVAAAALIAWGCSVEKHYKLLSFFFDGVPEPAAPEAQVAGTGARVPALGTIVSAHSAYLERRCAVCHGDQASFGFTTTGFSPMSGDACMRCHAATFEAVPVLHGPVAARDCVACHDPHASRYPLLLVAPSPALCLLCHYPKGQMAPAGPLHQDLGRDCLECHDPHGGANRDFLRPAELLSPPPAR